MWIIGPAKAQGPREGDEECMEMVCVWVVVLTELVTHGREGQVVDPCRVRCRKLFVRGVHPLWQTLEVLLRRRNLPSHEEEHDIENSNALWNPR